MKLFLKISNRSRGLSSAKKDNILGIVTNTLNELLTCYKLSSSVLVDDHIFTHLDLPLLSPVRPTSPPKKKQLADISNAQPAQKCISRYPAVTGNMSVEEFSKWTINRLQEYLGDRCVNRTGNKAKLVENAYGAYNLNLPITFTDAQEELTQIKFDLKEKLTLENGMVMLPNPETLKEDWIEAPSNLPDTLFENVKNYLDINKAGKAFKGGKSLLESRHVSNVMTHMISPNIRYCIVRCLCHPEQKLSKPPYDVWVCIHKDVGQVMTADCGCTAGYDILLYCCVYTRGKL